MDETAQQPLARALLSLEGLSIGDVFGQRFFALPATLHLLIGSVPSQRRRGAIPTTRIWHFRPAYLLGGGGLQPARARGTPGGKTRHQARGHADGVSSENCSSCMPRRSR
jgi:hypothetical protein